MESVSTASVRSGSISEQAIGKAAKTHSNRQPGATRRKFGASASKIFVNKSLIVLCGIRDVCLFVVTGTEAGKDTAERKRQSKDKLFQVNVLRLLTLSSMVMMVRFSLAFCIFFFQN